MRILFIYLCFFFWLRKLPLGTIIITLIRYPLTDFNWGISVCTKGLSPVAFSMVLLQIFEILHFQCVVESSRANTAHEVFHAMCILGARLSLDAGSHMNNIIGSNCCLDCLQLHILKTKFQISA